jgi:hypothetical protein
MIHEEERKSLKEKARKKRTNALRAFFGCRRPADEPAND